MKATANLFQAGALSSSMLLTANILAEEVKSNQTSTKPEATRKIR